MNDAITQTLSNGFSYSISSTYMKRRKGVYAQSNSKNMNLLAASCVKNAQAELSEMGELGIKIALGTVSGILSFRVSAQILRFLSVPIGSVQSIQFTFISAGINQTLHKINLCLSASVMIVPGNNSQVFVQTEALLQRT